MRNSKAKKLRRLADRLSKTTETSYTGNILNKECSRAVYKQLKETYKNGIQL